MQCHIWTNLFRFNKNGNYTIEISEKTYDEDSIKFSIIGYTPLVLKVIDYKLLPLKDISLKPQIIELNEIVVKPIRTEEKILGNKFNGNKIQAGFNENNKGFECGVLLKIKKKAHLKELVCNISECTYENIFYRINIYKEENKKSFVNILQKPIYINKKIDSKQTTLTIDLSQYNINVEGNTLITLEHIEDMGEGRLYFSGGLLGSTCYYRKTSQADWEKTPINLGFSVKAEVEK